MRYPGRASNSSAHRSQATRVGAALAAVVLLIGLFVIARAVNIIG